MAMAAITAPQTTRTLSTPRNRNQLGTPSAAVSTTPTKMQKNSMVRSAALASIEVSPRRKPTAYEMIAATMKTRTAQRIGCGPVMTRCEPKRASTHQQNSSMPTIKPGRPRSVMPGMISCAGIKEIRMIVRLSSAAASM